MQNWRLIFVHMEDDETFADFLRLPDFLLLFGAGVTGSLTTCTRACYDRQSHLAYTPR